MKILVPVKRVPHHDLPIRLRSDGNGIDQTTLRMAINPFDEVALEEALRLRENGLASDIIAISCGSKNSKQTLRTALAMGADRAILVETTEEVQSLAIAKLFASVVRRESIDLVFCGKQASDTDAGETGAMLAGILGWAQATAASSLHFAGERILVTSEIEGGQEVLSLSLPAVITADLRLNQPRYLTLQGSMQAVKKQIDILTPHDLKVEIQPRLKTIGLVEPPRRRKAVAVNNVDELLERLHSEAGVI